MPGYFYLFKILIISISLVLVSCAQAPKISEQEQNLRWPPESNIAYIQYVQEFSRPTDLGIEKSAWTRIMDFFSGEVNQQIVRPMDIVVDENDVIYVVDPGISGVHRFDRKNKTYKILRLKDDKPLPSPVAISLGPDHRIYVSDSQLGKVFTYTPTDEFLSAMKMDIHLYQPTGLAYDKKLDRLYISDTFMHRIISISSNGTFIAEYGSRGAGKLEFNYPTYIYVDTQHRLYVTDSLNFRIQILSQHGELVSMFGELGDATGNMARPKGVTTDSDGNIYIVDGLFNSIQIFDRKGQLLMPVGDRGTDIGQFWLPTGIHIDTNDYIYIADSHNQRVQIMHYLRKKPK